MSKQTHKFNRTDYEIIASWLAQYGPHELPSCLTSFPLSPIQSSMGRVVVLLANLVCNFDSRGSLDKEDSSAFISSVSFSEIERERFRKLQCFYHVQRFQHLKSKGWDVERVASMMGASIYQGAIEELEPLELSPRMLIKDETQRVSLTHVCVDILSKKAKEVELSLLHDLDLDEAASKKGQKKKSKRNMKKKCLQPNENFGEKNQVTVDEEEEINAVTISQAITVSKTKTLDKATSEAKMRVMFQQRSANKENKRVDVPKTNNIIAHLMVPITTEYDDRVSETALPQSKTSHEINAVCESIVPSMSPSKRYGASNSEVIGLLSEIESLKTENNQLRSEISLADQKSTEAVQRVQLKAYIAETARDSAVERATLLETLLFQVLDGKIGEKELQERLCTIQRQAISPTSASSLSALLNKLPNDTFIHLNSNQGQKQNGVQEELEHHKGILSKLRRGNEAEK